MQNSTATHEIASYIMGSDYSVLTPPVIDVAKQHILDGLAVMLAGAPTSAARIVQTHVESLGTHGSSNVLGTSLKAPAQMAALANGVAGHALDYDDTQLGTSPDRVYGLMTHPTVPALAACLAVGQETHADGKALLNAFCTGIEVECRIADAIYPRHYQQGFHSTGTIGTFSAAAAACQLLGLSFEQTRYALGIAASKAAGIRANFGTMTKPYHAGAAAQGGVEAAKLAALGFTSDPDALDGQWGFFQVTAGGFDLDRIHGRLGNPHYFIEPGVSIKPYPCGSLIHPAMDGLRDLVLEKDIKSNEIAKIRFGTTSNVLAALHYNEPQNELEAKFSIPFCLAIIVRDRAGGIAQFQDKVVQQSDVRQLMSKVRCYLDEEIEAKGFDLIRSRVDVTTIDGRNFIIYPELSRGTPQRPMSRSELEEKFRDCAQQVLPTPTVDQLIEALFTLETVKDINDLVSLTVV